MAFEKLYDYADKLAALYEKRQEFQYLEALTMYHDTVLSHAKFQHQKLHCRSLIYKLNPAYAEGYFGKPKP